MLLSAVGLHRLHLQWGFWLVCSQDDILTHLENHTTANLLQPQRKQSGEPSRGVFQGRSLLKYCNQVSCGEHRKLSVECLSVKRGTFLNPPRLTRGQRWDWGRGREEGRGSRIPRMPRVNTSSGSSGFSDAPERSLPRTLTHTRVRRGSLDTAPKKAQRARLAGSGSSLSLSLSLPCSAIKVCLRLWGNFAGYICNSHTAHTLLRYVSPIKAVPARFRLLVV